MPRGFDAFMVSAQIGTDRKLRRLDPAERWAFVAGVLALAAESPVRGALLIAEGEPVEAQDVADQALVDLETAENCLAGLRQLGVIVPDGQHGCDRLHNWSRWNPPTRPSDSREAWRERKRRERERKAKSDPAGPEPAAPAASQPPAPQPPRRSRRSRQTGPQRPPVPLDAHPATAPERATAALDEAVTDLTAAKPEVGVWLEGAHVHRVEDGHIVVGVQPEHASWVNDRIAAALADRVGHPVRAVACGEEAA